MTDGGGGRAPWKPGGVITLTTDFGLGDSFVGAMKGVIATLAPAARTIDLTHGIAAQDVRASAFQVRHAWTYFPAGTVHVIVVDPGVGSSRPILLALQDGHAFLAPDNGLLSGVLAPHAVVRELDTAKVALPRVSRTFHGRDLFAPAAARLARGEAPEDLAPREVAPRRLEWPRARALAGGGFEASVEVVDRFGNAITCLREDELEPARARGWVARVAGRELPIAGTYAEVERGEPLALLGSSGCWEVAVRDGDAARALGLERGAPVVFAPGEGA